MVLAVLCGTVTSLEGSLRPCRVQIASVLRARSADLHIPIVESPGNRVRP